MTNRSDILSRAGALMAPERVFDRPFTTDQVTVIPAASIRGAGGGGEGSRGEAEQGQGGGFAMNARPAGALEIRGDTVSWKVPFDLNRVITGFQLLTALVIVLRWLVLRARIRAGQP